MNGFINVLKPPGMSSGAVVAVVKRLTGEKVGHSGTLDPQAAGILPLMIGTATKVFDYLVEKRKVYVAEVAFGASTDTQDAQGVVIEKGENYPTLSQFLSALPQFEGVIMQCPPAYSAIKKDGQALYRLARTGAEIHTDARPVEVEKITFLHECDEHGFLVRVACGRGTYIRTLCEDIGKALQCPAHMRFLSRVECGMFSEDEAVTLEELAEAKENQTLQALMIPTDRPFEHLKRADAPPKLWRKLRNGCEVKSALIPELDDLAQCELGRLYIENEFSGIMFKEDGLIKYKTMLLKRDNV